MAIYKGSGPPLHQKGLSVHYSRFSVALLMCGHKGAPETTILLDSLTCYLNVSIKQTILFLDTKAKDYFFFQLEKNYRMHDNK